MKTLLGIVFLIGLAGCLLSSAYASLRSGKMEMGFGSFIRAGKFIDRKDAPKAYWLMITSELLASAGCVAVIGYALLRHGT